MRKAYCLIRQEPHYRSEAFRSGLAAAGYHVLSGSGDTAGPGDVIVCWNRYGHVENLCDAAEKRGVRVLVAENGYLGKDGKGIQMYALSRHGHNGSGQWFPGGSERWAALGIELKPWRESGDHILVCDQRGIGSRLMASPPGWGEKMARQIAEVTRRKVVVRSHPGNNPDPKAPPLEAQFRNCWAVVVWSSSAGLKALVEGIPVYYDAPHWIGAGAAASCKHIGTIECPPLPDRVPTLQSLAWAQWSIAEISTGAPFRHLLERAS